MRFHNHVIPEAHVILSFQAITVTELIIPIPGGNLDYSDPECDTTNLSELPRGQVFYWPKLLVSPDLPPDFQVDLQASLQGNDIKISDNSEDKIIKRAYINNNKACQRIVNRYTKNHIIEQFAIGDIIVLKLSRSTQISTDIKWVFGKVLAILHEYKYEIQTEWGIVK